MPIWVADGFSLKNENTLISKNGSGVELVRLFSVAYIIRTELTRQMSTISIEPLVRIHDHEEYTPKKLFKALPPTK
jgi:hypothetical protein